MAREADIKSALPRLQVKPGNTTLFKPPRPFPSPRTVCFLAEWHFCRQVAPQSFSGALCVRVAGKGYRK